MKTKGYEWSSYIYEKTACITKQLLVELFVWDLFIVYSPTDLRK